MEPNETDEQRLHRKYKDQRRAYYSEIITGEDVKDRDSYWIGAVKHTKYTWRVRTELYAPVIQQLIPPITPVQLAPAERWMTFLNEKAILFPVQTLKPKVQLQYKVEPKQLPRKVEIERRRRAYALKSLPSLLEELGIDKMSMIPIDVTLSMYDYDMTSLYRKNNFLPLELFDNVEYANRTEKDWRELAHIDGVQHPLPGLAFLPKATQEADNISTMSMSRHVDDSPDDLTRVFEWCCVAVIDYEPDTTLFTVLTSDGLQTIYRTPRIYCMFKAEDPTIFAQRIRDAVHLRDEVENLIRYELYVDCLPVVDFYEIETSWLTNIFRWATRNYVFKVQNIALWEWLTDEICLNHKRTFAELQFRHTVDANPHIYKFISVPKRDLRLLPRTKIETGMTNFEKVSKHIKWWILYVIPESYKAIELTVAECLKVHSMALFTTNHGKFIPLHEFHSIQIAHTNNIVKYLTGLWLENITHSIRMSLRDVGKGWFDLNMSRWETYKISKMMRLLELTKFHMQYALRVMVETSVTNLLTLLEIPCQCCLKVADDFVWGDDQVHSPFKPSNGAPIFLLILKLDKDKGAYYDTLPDDFPKVILTFLNVALRQLHYIKQVQPYLLPTIKWPDDLFLSSVGLLDPFVVKNRDMLETGYIKSVIPLKAYAAEYQKHLELYLLDNAAYVANYKEENHPAGEVRDEIANQFKFKAELEETIPLNIVIGPFFVNTKPLRTFLVDKRADLAKRLLDMFAARMRKLMDTLSDSYKLIYLKLLEKPQSIEEIYEIREWMETITMSVRNNEDLARRYLMEYEILNEFLYAVKDEDFQVKWEVIGWPHKISQQVEATVQFLIDETERYRKIQFDDEVELNDKIDIFVSKVVEFSKEKDIEKYDVVAVGIARLWKQMLEGRERALQLNQRQKLFLDPVVPFTHLVKLIKEFEPYKTLWTNVEAWFRMHTIWVDNPLVSVDGATIEDTLNDIHKTMVKLVRTFADFPDQQQIAMRIRDECEQFRPYVPLMQAIRNPGLKDRHYEMIAKQTGINIPWSDTLTFDKCLHLGLFKHMETVISISEAAAKEYAIEAGLNKMMEAWEENLMDIAPYKETGTYIMKIAEDQCQLLDDQIVQTQQISFSPFKAAFEKEIDEWEQKLRLTSKVVDIWNEVQKNWMYLEPIFTSEDISKQLPTESKKYNNMERIWRRVMRAASENPKIIEFCPDQKIFDAFHECLELLEIVQKGLSDYLETKRQSFPRFYFLSDDELLEILAQSKNPLAVQPHLKKCFEAISSLKFEPDLKMTQMNSGDGESVPLNPTLYPIGGVECWMLEVEASMRNTVRTVIQAGLADLTPATKRSVWVLSWPGQVVIAGSQTYWTAGVANALDNKELAKYVTYLLFYLDDLRNLVKGTLTRLQREIISALIVIEVHARDVTQQLLDLDIQNPNDFEWISQMRYYWVHDTDLKVRAVNAEFQYGYEYLGNTGRLVITPLTDRCYLTLTGALHLNMGGAPQGPAGTGKTETTKDLGKAMAIQTVVFNCSDQLDYMAMGKFFKGLASSGAWACFDEFNRIDIEVLSVIAQQVATIQKAQKARQDRFFFEGIDLQLRLSCAVFITMNPGYAGRTELPDNLKTLFRPVAMMVPNYALIAEISLFSFGFGDARALAGKITTTFKLSSEQLSAQDHYDFGMRAVKTVIAVAGNLKRERPKMDERQIVLRALRDVNVPKFLKDDLILFNGIVCDLFPRMVEQTINYGDLEASIRFIILKNGLEDVKGYRPAYTIREKKAILDYIRNNNCYDRTTGNDMWKEMSDYLKDHLQIDRTYHSLKEHYRRRLAPQELYRRIYGLTPEEILCFKNGRKMVQHQDNSGESDDDEFMEILRFEENREVSSRTSKTENSFQIPACLSCENRILETTNMSKRLTCPNCKAQYHVLFFANGKIHSMEKIK